MSTTDMHSGRHAVRFKTLLSALVAFSAIMATSSRAGTIDDTVDIDHLIAAYHQAVVQHDGARLVTLFLPAGTAWFSVLTEDGLTRVRATTPAAPKIRPGTVQGFVHMVSSGKAVLDPQHSDLHMQSDGTIATVSFQFTFFVDRKEQNHGSESWQLVKGDEGWRIASIVFSSTPSDP